VGVAVAEDDVEGEADEEEDRVGFFRGLRNTEDDVELIPREGGTERLLMTVPFLLVHARRTEAEAEAKRKRTKGVGREAVVEVSFFFRNE